MQFTSSLIALALLGADGAGPPKSGDHIVTEIRFLEMAGLDWRGKVHADLKVVAQRDGTTVWTTGCDTAETIAGMAEVVTATPKVAHIPGAVASVTKGVTRRYVAQLGRVADGPHDRATSVAFVPKVMDLQEGCQAHVTGKALDQGVLMRVELADTRFLAFHTVTCPEEVQPKGRDSKVVKVNAQYQLPEVATSRVSGEWLVPKDGVLVVSMGAYTVETSSGESMVRERLALIEAECPQQNSPMAGNPPRHPVLPPLAGPTPIYVVIPQGRVIAAMPDPAVGRLALVTRPSPAPVVPAHPVPISVSGLNATTPEMVPASPTTTINRMPNLPSRALPQGVTPDGKPVPLPPLPDEEAEAASFDEESAEPKPSPQTRPRPAEKPLSADLAANLSCEDRTSSGSPVIAQIPIGPLTGELRLRPGSPNRISLGLRFGSTAPPAPTDGDVKPASATRPTAPSCTKPGAKSASASCEAQESCCETKPASGSVNTLDIPAASLVRSYLGLGSTGSENRGDSTTGSRPIRIEFPIGEGSIHVEIHPRGSSSD